MRGSVTLSLFAFALLFSACGKTDSSATVSSSEPSAAEQVPVAMNGTHERDGDRSSSSIRYGDVLMRSLFIWPRGESDSNDTLATAKAFQVDRVLWIYENTAEQNQRFRSENIGIGTTMAHNAREIWIDKISQTEARDFVDKYTIKNLDGEQVILEHFKNFPNHLINFFQPDQTNEEWKKYYIDYVVSLYETGIDALHRDDQATCGWAPRSGGTFTDSAVEYFRRYLKERFTASQLSAMGVTDVQTFDVRDHFRMLGAPRDGSLWEWQGSPLMSLFRRAMTKADRDFFVDVRTAVEERTGRRIPWSSNQDGPILPLEEAFDFRVTEYQLHHNQPQTALALSAYPREAGKVQALISVVDSQWTQHPEQFIADTRRHIGTAYAVGMIPLVPWCMYMHQEPRYYGTVEDFGDLFHFVSENRRFFDEHELVSVSGIDTNESMQRRTARGMTLYSWLPNKEIVFEEGDAAARIWLNQENVFAFLRQNSDTTKAVIHLVDWNEEPRGFEMAFSPASVVGARAAKLTLLRPGDAPVVLTENYLGETIELPVLPPWGTVLVESVEVAEGAIPAPQISTPLRMVVPAGSLPTFGEPGPGITVMTRFVAEGAGDGVPFVSVQERGGPGIAETGVLEAFAIDEQSGSRSEALRVHFQTFEDRAVSHDINVSDGTTTDLSGRFTATSGEMRVNASFLADALLLMGEEVERGLSTQGDATVSATLDPSWKRFTVSAGLDDAEDRRPSARLQVLFDNELAFETPIINPSKLMLADQERRRFDIALVIPEGARTVQLRAVNGGFFRDHNNIVWAEPSAY